MADTVNLSEGARLLGLSQRTARKKLSPSYRGKDRIVGAKKIGRDWEIPRSEIKRLIDLRSKAAIRSMKWEEVLSAAFVVYMDLQDVASKRLVASTRAYADAMDGDRDPSGREGNELRRAWQASEDLAAGGTMLIDGIAARVQDREWLAEEFGWP